MNILFVRMSYIGDILHATPAARWIKEQYPEAKLHWIVTPSMAEILRHNPYVDEIIEWERDTYEAHSKQLHIRTMWRMWWELRDRIKPYQFDIAIDVQGRLITGLVLLASGAPIRLGLGGTKELNWLFTNVKSQSNEDHVIKRYLQVAQLLPYAIGKHGFCKNFGILNDTADQQERTYCSSPYDDTHLEPSIDSNEGDNLQMVLNLSKEEISWAHASVDSYFPESRDASHMFKENDLNASLALALTSRRPRIAIVPGSSWISKEWPMYHWSTLVEELSQDMDILYIGGPKEARDFSQQLPHNEHIYDMMGQTSIRESASLMKACDIVVSGDTGSLYMATSVQVPSVSLFGPTKPEQWGPLSGTYRVLQNSDVDCLGCRKRKCPKGHHKCMTDLTPTWVSQAIRELLIQITE